jgi:hypothetical protein
MPMSEHLPHRLWHAASVLDDQTAFLRAVERFAWQSDDGSPSKPEVGSVHMWFEGGHGVHLDGASDWILEWSVSEPGDDRWMRQYVYDCHGRGCCGSRQTRNRSSALSGHRSRRQCRYSTR